MKNETGLVEETKNKKYSIGLKFNEQSKAEIQATLGKQQTKNVEALFDTINKFKRTAVLTVLPDLLRQINELVMRARLAIIQEEVAAEEADESPEENDEAPRVDEETPIIPLYSEEQNKPLV